MISFTLLTRNRDPRDLIHLLVFENDIVTLLLLLLLFKK